MSQDKVTELQLETIAQDIREIKQLLTDPKAGIALRVHDLEQARKRQDRTIGMLVTAIVGGVVTFVIELFRRP